MGATRNTGYIENLIAYDGNNNIGVGGPVNVLYKVTIGGNTLISGNLNVTGTITFSSNVTANSFVKNGGVATEFLKADGTVDTSTYATVSYVDTSISNLIDAAPAALNTLNELAAALGDDSSFSTTVTTALGNRLRIDTDAQGLTSEQKANGRTNLGVVIGTDVQAYDADLGAIAALTGTSGLLKKTAANTWTLDTNTYITGGFIGTTALQSSSATQAMTGISSIEFVGHVNDVAKIEVTTNAAITYFDFTLADDNNQEEWRWRFNPTGGTIYSAMRLVPTTNTTSNLIVSGTIAASNFSGSSSGTNTGDQDLSGYQPIDADLTAIAALSGTSGFLKKTAANNWSLDTNSYVDTINPQYISGYKTFYDGISVQPTNALTNVINFTASMVPTNANPVGANFGFTWTADQNNQTFSAVYISAASPGNAGSYTGLTTYALRVSGNSRFQGTIESTQGYTITNANDTYSTPASTNVPYIYLYNTGTTGTSNAVLSLRTNSATGGDPILSFDIGQVIGWSMGIDNSDSDKFKIARSWSALDSETRFSMALDGTANFTGNLTAANLSGTNTGDQDLSGYVNITGAQTISGAKTFSTNLLVQGGRVNIYTGGVNTYGVVSGYSNNNHQMTMRANVTGPTATPTYTAGHQMCFVEYAEANDTTGWFFKTSETANYTEVARITRSGINWNGNTVYHAGNLTNLNQLTNGPGYITNTTSILTLTAGDGGAGSQATVVAIRVRGLNAYQSLELGTENDYAGVIRSYGNDIRYYSGHWRTVGTAASEDHSHYWYTSKNGSTNWSTVKMRLDHDGILTVSGSISTTGGNLHTNRGRVAFSSTAGDANHTIYNNYLNIDSEGAWDGMKMNVYNGLDVRTGAYTSPTTNFTVRSTGISAFASNGPVAVIRKTGSAPGNNSTMMVRNDYGNHSWGITAVFQIGAGSGTDRPSILFNHDYNSNNWGVGFCSTDDNFRIVRDHGYQHSTWGTQMMLLDRSGNVTFAGDVTAYSDVRLKTDINKIENAIEKISKINGVTFKRIDDIEDNVGRIHAGVIAQEVLEVLPEVVSKNTSGYYQVAYGNMVGLLIEAIKEQQKQIEELKSQIKNK